MPTLRFFYPNCDCCSGSGSSGSGSCNCLFYTVTAGCNGEAVGGHCPTDYVATIRLNFSGCGSSPIGSCGSSGSSGSDTEPTASGSVIPIESGSSGSSGSGSDCHICPSCCVIANKAWQITLRCIDFYLASDSFISTYGSTCFGSSAFSGQSGSDNCVGFRTDRCNGGQVIAGGDGISITGTFIVPLDGGFLYIGVNNFSVSSCNPFLMSGTVSSVTPLYTSTDYSAYSSVFPCLSACLDSSYLGGGGWSCVTGTVTVTEASTGSEGGGGGGGGPPPPIV